MFTKEPWPSLRLSAASRGGADLRASSSFLSILILRYEVLDVMVVTRLLWLYPCGSMRASRGRAVEGLMQCSESKEFVEKVIIPS